ncbi:MAG TPA: hypothetical protein VEZ17_09335, partial [Chitinophagaceae bacterium]|nr:hypothetical protein [Chitinophagaceae bacterium]
MKNTLAYFKLILILLLFCAAPAVYGQLSGIKKIPGDYATITLAVADLNTSGVGPGGVTFDVAAGYTETITATISLTATGTAGNPITFRRDPATPGVQPLITAYTGGIYTPGSSIQDGIWRLVGSDYVTIDGISLTENPANTSNPATMEYGYALYKASTSNGCQYVTVTNCVVSLTNINNAAGAAPMVDGSTGIIVMNATASAANNVLTPVAGGTNSYNKFYGNTIQNCNTGIALIGYSVPALPSTLGDKFNDVGGNTALTGNSILNYGGAPTAILPAAGIRTSAQYNFNASYNTINNNNGSGNKHPTTLRGIYLNTALGASATVTNNTVTIHGGGTTENIAGIENLSGGTAATNSIFITHNTIKNSTYTTATSGGFTGILNNAANPETLVIRLNSITNNSSAATTTGFFYGIHNSGPASVVSIDSNLISGNSSTSSTLTGNHIGIYNTGVSPVLNVTVNTVAGNVVSAITGVYFAIANSGAVTSSININSNHIGTASLPAVSFSAGSSVNHIFISNSQGGASSNLSISNNRFSTVQYLQAGTGGNTYISNAAATRSQVINSNTFTNMDVNTAGSITFILNSVAVPATGTQSVNGNSISGTFVKSGPGGVLTLFSSTASSLSGSVINNSNNNFSNITVVGATTISGWVNTDAGAGNKFIQNNIFSKWTAGTGGVTATSVSITGVNNATSGNLIESINSAGAITGILTSAGNDNIFSNTITA